MALECPNCRSNEHSRNATKVFATLTCPICMEECSPMITLKCGHLYCEPCFNRLGGVLSSNDHDDAVRQCQRIKRTGEQCRITTEALTIMYGRSRCLQAATAPAMGVRCVGARALLGPAALRALLGPAALVARHQSQSRPAAGRVPSCAYLNRYS